MADVMNVYEAMFLLGPSGADPEKAITIAKGMIEKHGGQIMVIKKWDERKLSYEVGKQKRGTYVISFFKAPGGAIAPMERDVKLSEDVLRVLVTKGDHLSEKEMNAVEPQPIAPPPERNSWDMPQMSGPRSGGDRDRSSGGDRSGGDRSGGDRSGGGDRAPRTPRRDDGGSDKPTVMADA